MIEREAEFWESRSILTHIRDVARARRAAPWATLGNVLARVVAATPPSVTLPPLVGGRASLNTFVAIVGPSSAGKGVSAAAAQYGVEIIGATFSETPPGTGEGLSSLFVEWDAKEQVLRRRAESALFDVPEIDTLTALGNRTGATIMGELRKAWSGERLGFGYATAAKRLIVQPHTYRLCMTVGVQPLKAGHLLGDSGGGTPQRFLWLPAIDPDAPDTPPATPDPEQWKQPDYEWTADVTLGVCDLARREIDAARLSGLRGQMPNELDGHAMQVRLKVAAALALLERRLSVSEEDWHLSDLIAQVSRATRERIQRVITDKARLDNAGKAHAEADREEIKTERADARNHKRAVLMIADKLKARRGQWIKRGEITVMLSRELRPFAEGALNELMNAGLVESRPTGNGQSTEYLTP
ncbi:hypothetical protein AB0F93_26295 [Micromonospora tulbaghiae]|uniref:hypothetical protein n=1 Tax=Micromonospora TaxID=1873 RepID=UPI000827AD21|nr:hypothetical protein [Micromonospora aurantiaca]SCL40058.1 hypothetical protein GA0070615_4259 [Micromonospora aurantiaca]